MDNKKLPFSVFDLGNGHYRVGGTALGGSPELLATKDRAAAEMVARQANEIAAEKERREAVKALVGLIVSMRLYDPSEKRRQWCPCEKRGKKCWQCDSYDTLARLRELGVVE